MSTMIGQFDRDTGPEFKIGDSVIVTGEVGRSGERGIIRGFVMRPSRTLYVVTFEDRSVADLPGRNLRHLISQQTSA